MKYSYLYGSAGKPLAYHVQPYKNKKFIIISIFLLVIFTIGTSVSQFTKSDFNTAEASPNLTNQFSNNETQAIAVDENTNDSTQENQTITEPELIDINSWLATHRDGDYSVAVYDGDKKIVDHQSDKKFYMASIYKLYVVYIGYQRIDSGMWDENEIYVNGWTRGKCLVEMIRTSNNECGEKMASEIGSPFIQTKLKYYGLTNTSFDYDFVTTVNDSAIILNRLNNNLDLSSDSTKKLKDSMIAQVHRDVLPRGLGKDWQVFDKVGFRSSEGEYHDVGIAVGPNEKVYIFSVFSTDAGVNNLANLTSYIRENLK